MISYQDQVKTGVSEIRCAGNSNFLRNKFTYVAQEIEALKQHMNFHECSL